MNDSDSSLGHEASDSRPSPEPGSSPASAAPRRPTLWQRLKSLLALRTVSLRDDLEVALESDGSGEVGDFTPSERTILKNVLELGEKRVDDVMVPRADIVAVQQSIEIGHLLRVFSSAGHSRLVVYNDTLDDPTGMVHIRDLVAYITRKATVTPEAKPKRRKSLPADLDLKAIDLSVPLTAANITRSILFVPESMPAIDLLVKMRTTRIHLALVVDEYGGTDGVVSMEDIVEQIVGDIEDEHDDEAAMIIAQADGSFVADARAGLEEAAERIGPAFAAGEESEDVDTIGGLLVTLAGRVPVRGEIIAGPGEFEVEVLDADPRRVKRVRIGKRPPETARREQRKRAGEDGGSVAPDLPKSETGASSDRQKS